MLLSAWLLLAAVTAPRPPADSVPSWSAPPYWTPPPATAAGEQGAGVVAEPDAIPTEPLVLVGIQPCRLVDTRGVPGGPTGAYGPPELAANVARSFDVDGGGCPGIPASAGAFSLNFTVIASPGGYQNAFLTVFPTGASQPNVSTLNFDGGELVANAAVVPAGTGASVDVFVNAAAHLIVDVNGYYVPLSSQTGSVVTSLAGGTGALTLSGTNGISASRVAQAITVTSNAASSATPSTIASRDANGLLRSTGLDVGTLQSTSNLVFANGIPLLHRTGGGLYLGTNAGNLASSCLRCVAVGDDALQAAVGSPNLLIAIGDDSLKALTSGSANVAVGDQAVSSMTTGALNTGVGNGALGNVVSGSQNAAFGASSLPSLTSGNDNVAVGRRAGVNLTSGDNNIYVGTSVGLAASGSESNTIRIGTATHTAAYLGGVYGQTSASGVSVLVNSSGKLGTPLSSRRYKTEIEDVGERSEVLAKLRPVTFLYREDLDPDRLRQYGLIAEEVAAVAPELVVLGEDGEPQTVRYHQLVPLLLDALQKQQREIAAQRLHADETHRRHAAEIDELRRELRALRAGLETR